MKQEGGMDCLRRRSYIPDIAPKDPRFKLLILSLKNALKAHSQSVSDAKNLQIKL